MGEIDALGGLVRTQGDEVLEELLRFCVVPRVQI